MRACGGAIDAPRQSRAHALAAPAKAQRGGGPPMPAACGGARVALERPRRRSATGRAGPSNRKLPPSPQDRRRELQRGRAAGRRAANMPTSAQRGTPRLVAPRRWTATAAKRAQLRQSPAHRATATGSAPPPREEDEVAHRRVRGPPHPCVICGAQQPRKLPGALEAPAPAARPARRPRAAATAAQRAATSTTTTSWTVRKASSAAA